ncbi:hypothetical protein [Actinophytocola sp.]|uniref:WXG100 family type VII secretion target n=1 Tax=Actinophytocola sp. TaxID=1872138 RepID=UPI002D7E4AA7|nr:hypothetical protein [Actinophytocola sp.]HET9143017.1 hypothetical protein [Actinophytocola sp.]
MTSTAAEDEAFVKDTLDLLNTLTTGTWVPPGLRTGGGLGALDATMRPIDALAANGLGWLTQYVQPLQQVLDGLAGNAAVVRQYTDHWQRAAKQIAEIRTEFERRVDQETSGWLGSAGDSYRIRARELTMALDAADHVAHATGLVATQMGEAVADARTRVNELLTDLVNRLISYAKQAIAVEGGVTPNVVAQCTSMIDTYRTPIATIEQRLQQALDTIQPPRTEAPPSNSGVGERIVDVLTNLASALSPTKVVNGIASAWRGVRAIFGRRPSRRQLREEERVYRERERERRKQISEDWRRYERSRYRGDRYSEGIGEIYGPPPNDGQTYVGHHNFPVKYARKFEQLGIDTSNPAWGTHVREIDHRGFSTQFERDWGSFFQNNPNATRADAFKFVRELATKYGYRVPF